MEESSDKKFNKKLKKLTDNLINKFHEEMYKLKESENFIAPRLEEIKQNQKDKGTCVLELKKMIEELEHKQAKLRKEVAELQIERKQQKTLVKRLENNFNDLKKVYEIREEELVAASQTLEISPKDKEILEIVRKKLSIYKSFTNVEWDYSVPVKNLHVAGYVQNSKHGYIQAFSYNRDKISEAELTDKLWNEVEKGIADGWQNLLQLKDKHELTQTEVEDEIIGDRENMVQIKDE